MASYEKGRYVCQITGQGYGQSAAKGTPYFFVTFNVMSKEGSSVPLENQYERTMELYMTEKTIDKMLDFVSSLGYTRGDFDGLNPEINGFYDLKEMPFIAECGHETNEQGKTFEKWELPYNPKNTQRKERPGLDQMGMLNLNAKFGKKLAERRAVTASAIKQPSEQPVVAVPWDNQF